jgi:hypothetical protein
MVATAGATALGLRPKVFSEQSNNIEFKTLIVALLKSGRDSLWQGILENLEIDYEGRLQK